MPKIYSDKFKADAITLVNRGLFVVRCMLIGGRVHLLQKWINGARLES